MTKIDHETSQTQRHTKHIDERSYIRSKAYYDEKRSHPAYRQRGDDVVELSAIVRGSGGSVYRQQIEIKWIMALLASMAPAIVRWVMTASM